MIKYDKYKQEEEAVWYDSIPISWTSTKMREVFSERREKVSDKDYPPLSVGKMGVVPQLDTAVKTDNGDNRKLIRKGDFAINSRSDRKGSGGMSNYDGSASLIITVLKPHHELNVNFYHYLLRNHYFSEEFYRNGKGLVSDLWTTKWEEMRNIYIPIPPRDEQDQIVRYLDWQVSKINHLIHGYQKQIKLLEERKLTILDQLVHNGILASEFKEYDIEYIGKVPAHWHVLQNHRIFESAKRKFEGVPTVLSLSQKDGLIPYSELNERTLHTASYDNWQLVHENDLVLNRFKAHLGVFFASKYTGIVTFHYGVYKPKMPLLSKYYETLYHTQVYKRVYAGQSKGMTIGLQNLSDTDFYSVYTLYPPYDEQVAIVREIESVEEKFLKIRAGIMKQIELLKEYRTRLISDVVTGQIDVRDVVIPEYTPEEDADIDTDDAGEDVEEVAEDAE